MKSTNNIVHDFFDGHVGMFPGVYDTGRNILEDDGSHISGWWIEYIGEVVFRKHRMCWVSTIWIRPWFVLVLLVSFSKHVLML